MTAEEIAIKVAKIRQLRLSMPWTSSEDAHAQMERNRQIVAERSSTSAPVKSKTSKRGRKSAA